MTEIQLKGYAVALTRIPKRQKLVRLLTHPAGGPAISLFAIGILAAGESLYATVWGPWVFSDGAGYIMLARNVIAGQGLGLIRASGQFQPLSMHPPLYPLTVAAFGFLGADLVQSARWVAAGLFSLTILFVGFAMSQFTGKRWLGVCAAVVIVASPILVELFTGALSEPLFFMTWQAGLLLLGIYWHRGRSWALFGAATLSGLALLARYPGAAVIAAGGLGLLIFASADAKRRWQEATLFTALSGAPGFIWLRWVQAQPGASPPRQWIWDFANLWERTRPVRGGLVEGFWDWIPLSPWLGQPPYRTKLIVLSLISLIIGLVLASALRGIFRRSGRNWRDLGALQLAVLLFAFVVCYLALFTAVFLFSRDPLDAADVDQRMLSPVYLSFLVGIFVVLAVAIDAWPGQKWIRGLAVVLTVLMVLWHLPKTVDLVTRLNQEGAGYTGKGWRSSETLRAAEQLSKDTQLISNESTAVMFLLDRPAYDLPARADNSVDDPPHRFGDGSDLVEQLFKQEGAALVLFDSIRWQLHRIYGEDSESWLARLTQGLHLHVLTEDGAIYFYDDVGGIDG